MKSTLLTAVTLVLLATPVWGIQINEIRVDQTGADDDEYFELFGTPGSLLDGLTYLVLGDSSAGSGVVEAAIDLAGHSIPSDGFFLAAEDGDTFGVAADLVVSLNFENSDNVTHLLVDGFTGSSGDDLDGNDDGVLDSLPWSGVVDGVALVEEPNPPASTEFHYADVLGLPIAGPNGSSAPQHVYRIPDGGNFVLGVADPTAGSDTPGASNVPEPASLILFSACGIICLIGRHLRR